MRTCSYPRSSGVHCHLTRSIPERRSCHIHRSISHTDHGNLFTQIVCRCICQIINSEEDISKTFSFDSEIVCFPYAGSDKYACITIPKQIFYFQNRTDRCIRSYLYIQLLQTDLITVKNTFRQPEFRNSILHDPADLIFPFKNRHSISLLCKLDRYRYSCRTGSDYCRFLTFLFNRQDFHTFQIHIRNIVLYTGKMYRIPFSSQYAMSFTLLFMITDN